MAARPDSRGPIPRTIATYLSLLGTICNAAVDTGYLDHSPLTLGRRRRRPATLTATAAAPPLPRMIWLTRPQVLCLADAIDPRYHALVILAAHTGARWSELTTLRWTDVRTNFPLDDGAVSGSGRLRLRPPTPADQQEQPTSRGQSRSGAGGRTIALDQHAIDGRARDLIFTSPGGTRGPGGQLASANFARVWHHALTAAGLDHVGPEQQRPRFHDLRHTHAVWLLAQQAPIGTIAKRLGHATPVVTIRMYQHPATLIAQDQLNTRRFGLPTHRRTR